MMGVISACAHLHPLQDIKIMYEVKLNQIKIIFNYLSL
jgi:hypothetical protein